MDSRLLLLTLSLTGNSAPVHPVRRIWPDRIKVMEPEEGSERLTEKDYHKGMSSRTRRSRKQKGSGLAGVVLGFALFVLLAAGAAVWWVLTPYGPPSETFVDIAPGTSTMGMGKQLEAAGVVRSQYAFYLLRRFEKGRLRAGYYRFDQPAALTDVYRRIARGDVFTIALTVPEGANVFDIAAKAEQAHLGTREDFLKAAASQVSLVADFDPGAVSLEGYLFPDTYRFAPDVTAEQMTAAMVQRFRVVAAQLGLKENVHQVVTLASLVERETAVSSERPLVASVFTNRISKKMALMTDPAVIYGLQLEGKWRGTIYQSDLGRDTAYNTYLHGGLPPGPIANPGIPSLKAAMEPAQSNYLYFVAAGKNPQGHSLFSATLDEQSRNVALYRKAEKQAGAR